ncbi:MAG: ATP-grasp domain-containing protein [Steroidobacteraceae bacterium]
MSFPGGSARGARRVALISARAARGLDEDMPSLLAALEQEGLVPEVLDWDDPLVRWADYDLSLLRSTWDYTDRLAQFRAWLERIAPLTRLHNPRPLILWNTDKHYLRDLAALGLPAVPSAFIEPGEPPGAAIERFLAGEPCAEFVVKPAVGAGSRGARRLGRAQLPEAQRHAAGLLESGRSVLLQPYLEGVERDGETALIFFAGQFSHAIRKGPLLRPNADPTRALFAPEHITARTPQPAELAVGERVLEALVASGRVRRAPLYARVDLLRDPAGAPLVLELELTEPSLFLDFAPGAAERLARHIAAALREG